MIFQHFCGIIRTSKRNGKREMTREQLLEENMKLKIELANAKLELNNLKRVIFGSKREYTPEANKAPIEEQCSLFDNPKDIEENVQGQIEENIEEITVHKKKKKKTKKAGIKRASLKIYTSKIQN